MKILFIFLLSATFYSTASAQFIMVVEMNKHIEGICNDKEVYALFPGFSGQVEAKCSSTKKEIEVLLNRISFLKENPTFKGKGMIGFYISCEGQMLECKMDKKTKNQELDSQVENIFKELEGWQAGTLDGRQVDSRMLYSFEIKKGKLILL